jgi:hypothetical protein
MNNFLAITFLIISSLLLNSCGITDHDHDNDNDHDYATTVILTLITNSIPADTVSATWKDLDGPGGALPSIIDTLKLRSGITYRGTIELYNESKSPRTDITAEIREYSYEHQFFYTPSASISNTIEWSITDTDKNNLPVGLQFEVLTKTSTVQGGSINIVLSHYDSITKDGIRKSLESDIDIDYPIIISQ